MKTGLILEGGASRGIFTAGVLDCLMDHDVQLPYVIGASAGGNNAMSYCSRQKGRTAALMTAPKDTTYYGMRQFFGSHRLIDLDKMCYEYPYDQFPFDFGAYFGSDMEVEYVCSCCETGKAEYLSEKADERRLLTICKATCSIPMLCEPVELDGLHYLDGSIADSIPIERALEKGCDKVLIVLTKPESSVVPTDYTRFKGVLTSMYKDYPAFVETCMGRLEDYRRAYDLMKRMVQEGSAYVLRPEMPPISKFERDNSRLTGFYRHGYDLTEKKSSELMRWMESTVKAQAV